MNKKDLELISPEDLMPLLMKVLSYLTDEQLKDFDKWLNELKKIKDSTN